MYIQDFLKMMEYVAPLVGEIDLHTERKLKRELEERKIKANREYLDTFGEVSSQSFKAYETCDSVYFRHLSRRTNIIRADLL